MGFRVRVHGSSIVLDRRLVLTLHLLREYALLQDWDLNHEADAVGKLHLQ